MNDFDFPYVDAIYREESNPRYRDNIYSLALPALVDQATMVNQLTHLPDFDPQERLLSSSERVQRADLVQTILFALPRVARLGQSMLKMLHTGYANRAPLSKADNQHQRTMYALQQAGTFCSVRNIGLAAQHSMSLVGASGCGKSFSLRNITGLVPPVIYHKSHGLWQVPFLYIEMSTDGESVHSLASAIFEELARLLPHSGYKEMYVIARRQNAELRLILALDLARKHGVGMIIVDESQNKRPGATEMRPNQRGVGRGQRKAESHLTKLLVTASNVSHIPVLFAGTLEMQDLLTRFTGARRLAGHGSEVWHPLECSGNLSAPGDFESILLALWRYQWVRNPVEISARWVSIFFHYTQGIPDIVVKLFESVQARAINDGIETLTAELVAETFDKEFEPAKLGVSALREKDEVLLEAVPDLHQPCNIERAKNSSVQIPLARPTVIRKRAPSEPFIPKEPRLPRERAARPALRPSKIEVPREADLRQLDASSRTAIKGIATALGEAPFAT